MLLGLGLANKITRVNSNTRYGFGVQTLKGLGIQCLGTNRIIKPCNL